MWEYLGVGIFLYWVWARHDREEEFRLAQMEKEAIKEMDAREHQWIDYGEPTRPSTWDSVDPALRAPDGQSLYKSGFTEDSIKMYLAMPGFMEGQKNRQRIAFEEHSHMPSFARDQITGENKSSVWWDRQPEYQRQLTEVYLEKSGEKAEYRKVNRDASGAIWSAEYSPPSGVSFV